MTQKEIDAAWEELIIAEKKEAYKKAKETEWVTWVAARDGT